MNRQRKSIDTYISEAKKEHANLVELGKKAQVTKSLGGFIGLFSSKTMRKQNKVSSQLMKGSNSNNKDVLIEKFKEVNKKETSQQPEVSKMNIINLITKKTQ